jgi:peptide/nickel transport system substrate-binding protein
MRRLPFRFLAASSAALIATAWALAATRPRYGGALRLELASRVESLDPSVPASSDAEAEDRRRLEEMLFDRLVRLDREGRPVPSLAVSWSHDTESKSWQFTLRPGVKLANGHSLLLNDVASSLIAANPVWHVATSGGKLTIETASPCAELPAELALARNSIIHRVEEGGIIGSGPFHLVEWQAGRHAVLAANDNYWGGRPYVDTVEITLGRSHQRQLIDLELGTADVIELGLDQLRRAEQENLRTLTSLPSELVAIQFAPGEPGPDGARQRRALALAVDRQTIHDVLLRKQGEAAGGLLPGWLSGYAFLFPSTRDLPQARELLNGFLDGRELELGYDASDALVRTVAQRVALDARDAGLSVRAVALDPAGRAAAPPARLIRLRLQTSNPRIALATMAQTLHEPVLQLRAESASSGEFYEIERSLLDRYELVPLFYLPQIFALSARVREWSVSPTGGWRPEAAWLAMEKP